MKFLHVADLHIGKLLNQKSLISDQRHMLNEIISMMEDNDIKILLIAGDIYDKQRLAHRRRIYARLQAQSIRIHGDRGSSFGKRFYSFAFFRKV